jgi:uncharacterized repeat protein (TIGR01451 family)
MAVALSPSAAQAHQNPQNCDSNSPTLRISRDRPIVRIGESVTYTVFAGNPGATACDITNATITLQTPGADGQPAGNPLIIAQGLDLLSNSAERQVGRVTVPINVTPGVTDAVSRARATGVLHDAPIDHTADDSKTLGTTVVVAPGIHVEKTGSVPNNVAPQNATYTFTVTNVSNPPLPLDNVTVSDSLCPGVQGPLAGGDANNDRRLDPTEKWVYTCTMTHPAAGVYNNVVTACAELILNGKSDKVCDDAPFSITLIAPAPQVAVKPVAVNQAPCTLARANATTVRAGQLNTIRVRVSGVDAGAKITLTLPGGKKYTATAKNGIATFRVRPTRSGTARISAPDCSDVERLSVKPARRVVAQRPPRVTG